MKYSQDMKATWKIIKSLINGSHGTTCTMTEFLKINGKMVEEPMEIAHHFNTFLPGLVKP